MYYGTDFYLVKQLELKDIRLVYAPPESIGNYGDEIDNFMWPRHSGDFAFYRAYVGKDGKPAEFSPDNVPFVPKAWLQVSTEIGRAHVCTPVTNAHLVCRPLLEKTHNTTSSTNNQYD